MRRVIGSAVLMVLAATVVRCANDPGGPGEITQLPRDLSGSEQELIQSDNFREVHDHEGSGKNLFISPLSVAMALGMAYNGADGTTQQAMQQTLELQGMTLPDVNESYKSLIELLGGLDPAVEFQIANSIWYREGFPVEQDFLDVNVEYFDAEVASLDFASPDAAPTINAWVDEKTNGKIDEIVDSPIDPDLVMFLINAIYFKGNWTTQFDKDRTGPAPFFLADGSQKQVETMYYADADTVKYFMDSEVSVLDLAYGGKAYSMTIVMPAQGTDIASLIASLDAGDWQTWIDGLGLAEAIVSMPKFTLEYEVDLSDVLKALGMEIAFDQLAADFTKIYPGPERIYISRVKHKTFVEVNEEGTEAAAATSVEVGITSAPPFVQVDRPFLFAIRERFSGAVLFMGVIVDPQ